MDKLITLVTTLTTKFGTKFMVAGGGIYAIYYLADAGKVDGLYATLAVLGVVVTYSFARHKQETVNPGSLEPKTPAKE